MAFTVFRMWTLRCNRCNLKNVVLCWDHQLPEGCRCGGRFFEEVPKIMGPTELSKPLHSTRAEDILADLGEMA